MMPRNDHEPGFAAADCLKHRDISKHEQDRKNFFAFGCIGWAFRTVEDDEEGSGKDARHPVIGLGDEGESGGQDCQEKEVVDAPTEVSRTEDTHGDGFGVIRARHVVVGDVHVGAKTVAREQDKRSA